MTNWMSFATGPRCAQPGFDSAHIFAGYESEVEEDATERHGEETFQEQKAERRKPEPYDVPTSGAFWMHDDRMDDEEFAASGCATLSAIYLKPRSAFTLSPTSWCLYMYLFSSLRPESCRTVISYTSTMLTPLGCCQPILLVHNAGDSRPQALVCCTSCLQGGVLMISVAQARSAATEEEVV